MLFLQNLIYNHIFTGIQDNGHFSKITNNLVTKILHSGSYYDPIKTEDFATWGAGIDVSGSYGPTLENNTVAGAERIGFHIDGESCSGTIEIIDEEEQSVPAWKGNICCTDCLFIDAQHNSGVCKIDKIEHVNCLMTLYL